MKLPVVLLAGSLALNVVGLFCFFSATREKTTGSAAGAATSAPAVAPAATPSKKNPVTATDLLALEPAALRGELQRLKLPREVIDALVTARIYARHDARRRELMLGVSRLPWWQLVTARPDRL